MSENCTDARTNIEIEKGDTIVYILALTPNRAKEESAPSLSYSEVVITLDFESSIPSSNLGGRNFLGLGLLFFPFCCVVALKVMLLFLS